MPPNGIRARSGGKRPSVRGGTPLAHKRLVDGCSKGICFARARDSIGPSHASRTSPTMSASILPADRSSAGHVVSGAFQGGLPRALGGVLSQGAASGRALARDGHSDDEDALGQHQPGRTHHAQRQADPGAKAPYRLCDLLRALPSVGAEPRAPSLSVAGSRPARLAGETREAERVRVWVRLDGWLCHSQSPTPSRAFPLAMDRPVILPGHQGDSSSPVSPQS